LRREPGNLFASAKTNTLSCLVSSQRIIMGQILWASWIGLQADDGMRIAGSSRVNHPWVSTRLCGEFVDLWVVVILEAAET
jgi:hypothetical protein